MNRETLEKMGWKLEGQCGVDSGQMMLVDPCYILNEKDYKDMLKHRDKTGNMNACKFKKGLISNTWMGDGNYHVYSQKDKDGRVERLMIDFTTTYGYDDKNPNHHDIDMKELIKKVWESQEAI